MNDAPRFRETRVHRRLAPPRVWERLATTGKIPGIAASFGIELDHQKGKKDPSLYALKKDTLAGYRRSAILGRAATTDERATTSFSRSMSLGCVMDTPLLSRLPASL
jgi:hypothetical protein